MSTICLKISEKSTNALTLVYILDRSNFDKDFAGCGEIGDAAWEEDDADVGEVEAEGVGRVEGADGGDTDRNDGKEGHGREPPVLKVFP